MEQFVKGGAFLIESISPQEVFTPETLMKSSG